jgi:hypothetical protein
LDVLLAHIKALNRRNLKNKNYKIEINFLESKKEILLEINFENNEVLKN